MRATVIALEGLTSDDELGGRHGAVLAGAGDVPDFRVGERGGVELMAASSWSLNIRNGVTLSTQCFPPCHRGCRSETSLSRSALELSRVEAAMSSSTPSKQSDEDRQPQSEGSHLADGADEHRESCVRWR